MKIIAVMPIKLNNERLPGKNTMMLGGKYLLNHMIDSLAACSRIERICVYCSSRSICDYIDDGVEFVQRSKDLDLSTSNFTQIFDAFMKERPADVYVFAHATAPYVRFSTINKMIDAVLDGGHDSAFTATKIQDFLWQDGRPLNFDPTNLPRSQDIKPIYRETSGVYVFRREVFQTMRRRIGNTPYVATVDPREAVDINTREDFAMAEALLNMGV